MGYQNYLKLKELPEVYPAREDTWFLTDFLLGFVEKEIQRNHPIGQVCEIGVGTGYISSILGYNFPKIQFIGIDIYIGAVKLSYQNMSHWIPFDRFSLICGDLLHAINPSIYKPDVIYFNPPYVRTAEYMEGDPLIRTWAGGSSGTAVIHRFLNSLKNFDFQMAFFLSSLFNENETLQTNFQAYFKFEIVAEKTVEDEKLLCFQVKSHT